MGKKRVLKNVTAEYEAADFVDDETVAMDANNAVGDELVPAAEVADEAVEAVSVLAEVVDDADSADGAQAAVGDADSGSGEAADANDDGEVEQFAPPVRQRMREPRNRHCSVL